MTITAAEVILNSSLSDNTSEVEISKHIDLAVLQLKGLHFGTDFYDLLLANRVDFTCVDMFVHNSSYELDALIQYGLQIFKSSIDVNTTAPCTKTSQWVLVEPYTDCYLQLWNNGLKQYLAYSIAADALPFISRKAGSKGVVEFVEDNTGIRSASQSTLSSTIISYQSTANKWFDAMRKYMSDNVVNCPTFSQALFLDLCSDEPNTRNSLVSRFGYE